MTTAVEESTSTTAATAASTATAADRHAVTITLDAQAYEHYNKLAKDDDRSLAKYLARKLQRQFEHEQANTSSSPNLGGGTISGGLAGLSTGTTFRG